MTEGYSPGLVLFDLEKGLHIENTMFDGASVCLIASDRPVSIHPQPIRELTNYGCKFFLSWGNFSDEIHDALDVLLEQGGNLDVVTTAHKDENIEEVSWFFVNATFPMEKKVKYFLGYDVQLGNLSDLIERINRYIVNRDR